MTEKVLRMRGKEYPLTYEDYCHQCGCPLNVCCGQNKVSLEWLETAFEHLLEDTANNDESPLSYTMVVLIKNKILPAAEKEAKK